MLLAPRYLKCETSISCQLEVWWRHKTVLSRWSMFGEMKCPNIWVLVYIPQCLLSVSYTRNYGTFQKRWRWPIVLLGQPFCVHKGFSPLASHADNWVQTWGWCRMSWKTILQWYLYTQRRIPVAAQSRQVIYSLSLFQWLPFNKICEKITNFRYLS